MCDKLKILILVAEAFTWARGNIQRLPPWLQPLQTPKYLKAPNAPEQIFQGFQQTAVTGETTPHPGLPPDVRIPPRVNNSFTSRALKATQYWSKAVAHRVSHSSLQMDTSKGTRICMYALCCFAWNYRAALGCRELHCEHRCSGMCEKWTCWENEGYSIIKYFHYRNLSKMNILIPSGPFLCLYQREQQHILVHEDNQWDAQLSVLWICYWLPGILWSQHRPLSGTCKNWKRV